MPYKRVEEQIINLTEDILDLISTGKVSLYADAEVVVFKPGTTLKLNDMLRTRNELVALYRQEYARNQAQEEKTFNVDSPRLVG